MEVSNPSATIFFEKSLVLTTKRFWNDKIDICLKHFSWHEIGTYDLPAMINKTLETSGQDKLFYIGHSMGTK